VTLFIVGLQEDSTYFFLKHYTSMR